MPDDIIEQEDLDGQMMLLIKKKVKAFNPRRKAELLETKANIAYLCNHQNIGVEGGTIRELPEAHKYFIHVTANKLLPAVRNDIAVSTKTKPTFDIVPAGTDEDDKATAKAGNKILPYLQRINDPHLHRKGVVLWYEIIGSGWRKIYWDPNAKVDRMNSQQGDEDFDPNYPPMAPIFKGEVRVELIPNTELIYDHRIKDIRRLLWIIHAKSITKGDARSRFGDIVDQVSKAAWRENRKGESTFDAQVAGDFARLSQDLLTTPSKPEEAHLTEDDKETNIYEFWHIIDKNMPQGSFAVGLGDLDKLVAVANQPYPIETYPHQELPFVGASPLSLSGITIRSPANLTIARPLQREYNKVRSEILDHCDALGAGVIFAPRGANIDYKKMDNLHGNIIEYDGAGMNKPSREPGVPLQGGVFAHLDTILKDIDEVFAFHEPSKGIMPEGGPRSAIGLQTLQEADATQLSPMIIGLDEADERVAHQMLSLALANYGERMIEIIGKDNRWTLEQINAAELNGKVNVIVRTGSSLPMNKTLEMEKTVFAWQSGLMGDPNDPEIRAKVLKAMELGSFDQVLQDNAKQENFAKMEFIQAEKLAQQMPPDGDLAQFVFVPPINSFDDHHVHKKEHTNWILDKYYEYIGSGQPQFQILAQAFLDHSNMHGQAIYEAQMMQIQQQMLIKGVTLEQKGQTMAQIKAKKSTSTKK
jgi:hypothetical protein